MYVTTVGILLMLVYASISGFGSVFNEYIMKFGSGNENINLQNVILYSWGLLFNLIGIFMTGFGGGDSDDATTAMEGGPGELRTEDVSSLFGFTSMAQFVWWTLFLLNGAFHGLIISAVMKHLSSIWKLFMNGLAIPIAGIWQMVMFGAVLNGYFFLACVLVVVSLYVYKTPGVLDEWLLKMGLGQLSSSSSRTSTTKNGATYAKVGVVDGGNGDADDATV